MSFVFRLENYPRHLERVGEATYLDVTRRTDPARIERVWDNLRAVVDAYGAPSIVRIWTKDAAGTLARGGRLLQRLVEAGTTLAAQVTVTGLGGTVWEPLTPTEPFAGVTDLMVLAGGANHVRWRYDPVIPTIHSLWRFRRLAEGAAKLGIRHCVLNFVAVPGRYKRVDARLADALPGWHDGMPGYNEAWRAETAARLVEAANEFGLTVAACAESAGLVGRVPGLGAAACGDHDWFVALSAGIPVARQPPAAGQTAAAPPTLT